MGYNGDMDILYIILSQLLSFTAATIIGLYLPSWRKRLDRKKAKKAGPQVSGFTIENP
jgi:hypothetical protein